MERLKLAQLTLQFTPHLLVDIRLVVFSALCVNISVLLRTTWVFQIKGFPTIKYFKLGQVEEYNGGRSSEDIVQFGLQKAAMNKPPPEVKEITSNDVLHEACDNKQLCIIGFLPHLLDCQSKCRQRYLDVMKDAAKKHKEKDWGFVWSCLL